MWIPTLVNFGTQTVGFLISSFFQTEKFYDLTGALSYHLSIYTFLYQRTQPLSLRQQLVTGQVLLWSFRLGSFLFSRVLKHRDERFDKIKTKPLRFFIAWMMQGIWVLITPMPVYLLLSKQDSLALGWTDAVGGALWSVGFLVEALADYQKSKFKAKHPQDFVNTGLWKYSRFPNYFGEILLWIGSTVICAPNLQGWERLACLSPAFIAWLIINISGVRLAEKSQAKRYGARADYKEYCARTSKYVPWPLKQKSE